MLSTLLWCVLGTAVPEVVSGPALLERAKAVALPVKSVTVYSDRAQVVRQGVVALTPGIQAVRLPDLPGAALTDTVRLQAEGATLLRLEVYPVLRERVSIDALDRIIGEIEVLQDEADAMARQIAVHHAEVGLLAGLIPKALAGEDARLQAKAPTTLAPTAWQAVLAFMEARRSQAVGSIAVLQAKRRGVMAKLESASREAERLNGEGLSDRRLEVVAILELPRAIQITLNLEYFAAGAYWLPVYDVRFSPDAGKVTLEAAGLVAQGTGEDWADVQLSLSTAIPGQGIDLPKLDTWTLGEAREFIPQSYARQALPTADRFAPPQASETTRESTNEARRDVLLQRLAVLQQQLNARRGPTREMTESDDSGLLGDAPIAQEETKASEKRRTTMDWGGASVAGQLAQPQRSVAMSRKTSPRPAAPPPPPTMAPMPSTAMVNEVDATIAVAGTGGKRSRRAEPAASLVPLALHGIDGPLPPQFSDPNLPAVIAGGFDYVYRSATKVDVPGTEQSVRVPLRALSFPVTTFYEASPALMPVAYLKARVENKEGQAVLRGRANIFVEGTFISDGTLETTGPGGTLDLPLGADENIKLVRRVVPKSVTEGVFSKKDVTVYEVTIEVANYKKAAVRVQVVDQLPKSRQPDVEISYLNASAPPKEGPDADGLLRWEVNVAPGKTTTLTFKYQIKRPKDWQLQAGSGAR